MKRNKYQLLVFDWDGTLADSTGSIIAAMQSAITALAMEARSDQEIRDIIGLSLADAGRALYPDISTEQNEILVNQYRMQYVQSNKGKTRLFAGARETLEKLRSNNIHLAVATGKSRKGLEHSLQDTGLERIFDYTRCADESFSKPHPQMLLDIMEKLVIEQENTLMIGDSEYDMQMAVNAGVKAVAAGYGSQSPDRLLEYNPVACLKNINELWQWLSN